MHELSTLTKEAENTNVLQLKSKIQEIGKLQLKFNALIAKAVIYG